MRGEPQACGRTSHRRHPPRLAPRSALRPTDQQQKPAPPGPMRDVTTWHGAVRHLRLFEHLKLNEPRTPRGAGAAFRSSGALELRLLFPANSRGGTPPVVGPFFRRGFVSRGIGRGQTQPRLLPPTRSQPWLGFVARCGDAAISRYNEKKRTINASQAFIKKRFSCFRGRQITHSRKKLILSVFAPHFRDRVDLPKESATWGLA